MSERAVEAHGPDVETAIKSGLERLGLDRNDVIVEIVEEGRKGLLGLGGKEATVRLTPLPTPETRRPPSVAREEEEEVERKGPEARLQPEAARPDVVVEDEREPEPEEVDAEVEQQETEEVATRIVRTLLDKMGFEEASVTVTHSEPDDRTGREMTIIEVEGDELGALIGPHGETLNDFQYLARLMAGHALRRRADFLVDIDGYRRQRRQALTRLAQRMAQKAVDRESPVTLEPMSAYDRRLVHVALRDHDEVYTNSVGEGAERRVRIYLKQA